MATRTLLLTPWFFPIKVLRWQDAIKMKYEETAEVVVEYDEEVCSPSITWKMPAVIRLKKLKMDRKVGVKFSRINVYTRDNFKCQYCGKRHPVSKLSYDHVVPRASGGRTVWENIVTCCRTCNARKDSKSCDDAGMFPLHEPRRPKSLPVTPPLIDPATAPAEWQGYLGMIPA